MPELLLELGTEELPASSVERAFLELKAQIARVLSEAGVLDGDGVAMGTPRRLIVSFPSVRERQEDQVKEQRGPSVKAAFDADGNPTQALLGFCRSQGVEVSSLRNDGQYVWVTKQIPGRQTRDRLSEALPKAIRALTFDKTMRWGNSRMRFARPIRWILASFGGEVVPFEIEGVRSGLESRGHRFYAPHSFRAATLSELLEDLRARKVEPDPERRRQTIVEQARRVAGGEPQMSDALIDENVYLTEWPTAISGEFRAEFQELPEPVLITAMAKHEKMFPVRDANGRLLNRFVFIRNSGEDDTVRAGNEWVLNARFNDAKFFYDEDARHSLADFLERTSGILFQEKLGTVRQRADRLAGLAQAIARLTGADEAEADLARLAGLYAKADLATGLVSELSSLQGIVGGEYARREGHPPEVCWAIETQYDFGRNERVSDARGRTAVRLALADQIDKLAGYLGLGLAPSGSSDPFGLRRATTLAIEASWQWPGAMPDLDVLMREAIARYAAQGVPLNEEDALRLLAELLASRYEALLPDARYDLLEAALRDRSAADVCSPRGVRLRLRCLERVVDDVPFVQTATRPINILTAAKRKGVPFEEDVHDPAALQSEDGARLYEALKGQDEALHAAVADEDDEQIVRLLLNLAEPINRFFDSTMVMDQDEVTRTARLSLMRVASRQLLVAGDWSKIVIEG